MMEKHEKDGGFMNFLELKALLGRHIGNETHQFTLNQTATAYGKEYKISTMELYYNEAETVVETCVEGVAIHNGFLSGRVSLFKEGLGVSLRDPLNKHDTEFEKTRMSRIVSYVSKIAQEQLAKEIERHKTAIAELKKKFMEELFSHPPDLNGYRSHIFNPS